MQEKNDKKLIEMENEAVIRNASRERDNMYKIQSVNAFQRRVHNSSYESFDAVVSPRCLNTLDPERRSQYLSKALSQQRSKAVKSACSTNYNNEKDEEKMYEDPKEGDGRDRFDQRRTTYNDVLKNNLKRKVKSIHRYNKTEIRSPTERMSSVDQEQ